MFLTMKGTLPGVNGRDIEPTTTEDILKVDVGKTEEELEGPKEKGIF